VALSATSKRSTLRSGLRDLVVVEPTEPGIALSAGGEQTLVLRVDGAWDGGGVEDARTFAVPHVLIRFECVPVGSAGGCGLALAPVGTPEPATSGARGVLMTGHSGSELGLAKLTVRGVQGGTYRLDFHLDDLLPSGTHGPRLRTRAITVEVTP
jgi:hypothetical protein